MQDADTWLQRYGQAWERRSGEEAAALFAPDGIYAWGPFEEPLRGRGAIRARWDAATAHQSDVQFSARLLGQVDGTNIAHWHCTFAVSGMEGRIDLDGVFLIVLDESGLCTDFREWWNERSLPA
jgi:SnoaL-like protein